MRHKNEGREKQDFAPTSKKNQGGKSGFSGKNEHGPHNEEERQALKEDVRFVEQVELSFVLVVFKSFSYY